MTTIYRGMRVNLKNLLADGYKGPCTVLGTDGDLVWILPDPDDSLRQKGMCLRHEVSIMRDQTPNAIHARLLLNDEKNHEH